MNISKFFFLLLLFGVIACSEKGAKKESEAQIQLVQFPKGNLDTNSVEVIEWKRKIGEHYQRLHLYAHFNGCVLVARNGVVIYKGSFGVVDVSSKEALTTQSVFQIASLSKTFTAMAALKLWDEGLLNLESKLKDFFPNIPYPNVTVHDLLSHRSGLPNYLQATEKEWEGQKELKNNRELLRFLETKSPPIQSLPGKRFAYNNTNYALLALIIEQVSGISFETYMQERIFQPLGMNSTFVFSAQHQDLNQQEITTGYLRKNQPDQLFPVDGITGDKNIYSTVEDLLIWERATTHPGIFSKEVLETAVLPRSHERPGVRNYGYGWRLMGKSAGEQLVYHNGWWHGYTSAFYKNPKDETVVIVLSNIYNRSTYKVQPVWDILYGENGNLGFDQ